MSLLDEPLLSVVPVVDGHKVLAPAILLEKIGAGGTGTVYRGHHQNLDIEVAVKVLHPTLAAQEPDFVERFRREANMAAAINHPHLVRVFDVRESHGLHYLLQELVVGGTVMDRIQAVGRLGLSEAVEIALGAARGVAAAHAVGIVHRDIKPENIMLDGARRVKVTDLGLAKATGTSGLTATQFAIGTPRYMAPEQWEDAGKVGVTADVWALGATLYYMLTGEHALGDGTPTQIVRRVALQEFPDVRQARPEVPPELAALLDRCVAREPSERFQNASELVAALEQLKAHWVATAQDGDSDDNATLMLGWQPKPAAGTSPAGAAPAAGFAPAPDARGAPVAPGRQDTVLLDRRGTKRSSSRVLWILLLLMIAGGAGAVIWKQRADHDKALQALRHGATKAQQDAEAAVAALQAMRRDLTQRTDPSWVRAAGIVIDRVVEGEPTLQSSMRRGKEALAAGAYKKATSQYGDAKIQAEGLLAHLNDAPLHVARFRLEQEVGELRKQTYRFYADNSLNPGATLHAADAALGRGEQDRLPEQAVNSYRAAESLYNKARAEAVRLVRERGDAVRLEAEKLRRELHAYGQTEQVPVLPTRKTADASFAAAKYVDAVRDYTAALVQARAWVKRRQPALDARNRAEAFFRAAKMAEPASMTRGRTALVDFDFERATEQFEQAIAAGRAQLKDSEAASAAREKVVLFAKKHRLSFPPEVAHGDRALTQRDYASAGRFYAVGLRNLERLVAVLGAAEKAAEVEYSKLAAFAKKVPKWPIEKDLKSGRVLITERTLDSLKRAQTQLATANRNVAAAYKAMRLAGEAFTRAKNWHVEKKYVFGGPVFSQAMRDSHLGLKAIQKCDYVTGAKQYDKSRRTWDRARKFTLLKIDTVRLRDSTAKELHAIHAEYKKRKVGSSRDYEASVKVFNEYAKTDFLFASEAQIQKAYRGFQRAKGLADRAWKALTGRDWRE